MWTNKRAILWSELSSEEKKAIEAYLRNGLLRGIEPNADVVALINDINVGEESSGKVYYATVVIGGINVTATLTPHKKKLLLQKTL